MISRLWCGAIPFGVLAQRRHHMKKGVTSVSRNPLSPKIGELGFEPRTSCSQSRRANRTALHPVAF